jgi:AraC family transcriptional regulator
MKKSVFTMKPEIRVLEEKKLVGKHMVMTFSENKTGELWRGFMPGRKEIKNIQGSEFYSLQIYSHLFFENFNPDKEFEKWAAMEVTDFENIPADMQSFILEGGLYAVFQYRGAAKDAEETFRYILGTWLPGSGYSLDNRPHFEILGKKYKNDSPDSEEEIWIPVKPDHIPSSIAPWLTVKNSKEAVAFYKSAFGATEVYRLEGEGEDLVARLSINGAEFWVSNDNSITNTPENTGGNTIRMILTVTDPDSLFIQALKAGATEVFPVGEEHGWRLGRLVDPFGLHWEIGRQLTNYDESAHS